MTDTGIVKIHNKEYHTVAKRVNDFRAEYAEFGILTDIAFREGSLVAVKAIITDEKGRILATGHAEEDRTRGQINKTSALENAETSAIGRALAAFGIGGTEFASANEVENAVHQQNEPQQVISEAQRTELMDLFASTGVNADPYLKRASDNAGFEVKNLAYLPLSEFEALKTHLQSKKEKVPENA